MEDLRRDLEGINEEDYEEGSCYFQVEVGNWWVFDEEEDDWVERDKWLENHEWPEEGEGPEEMWDTTECGSIFHYGRDLFIYKIVNGKLYYCRHGYGDVTHIKEADNKGNRYPEWEEE